MIRGCPLESGRASPETGQREEPSEQPVGKGHRPVIVAAKGLTLMAGAELTRGL